MKNQDRPGVTSKAALRIFRAHYPHLCGFRWRRVEPYGLVLEARQGRGRPHGILYTKAQAERHLQSVRGNQ